MTNKQHKTIYILVGLPGSGKSTWAKQTGLPIVSRDIIREERGIVNGAHKGIGTPEQEFEIKEENFNRIRNLCEQGVDFVVDNTHAGSARMVTVMVAKEYGYNVVGVNVRTDIETCIERRKDSIPEEAIRNLAKAVKFFTIEECDEVIEIDGTQHKS